MQRPADNFFTYKINITKNDIDDLGHVSNIVYLRWIQDASEAHWKSLTNEKMQQSRIWVVLRHEIDYMHPVLLHDDIVAFTWVGPYKGAKSERFVQICNAKTGKCVAQAKTTWCLLSSKSMRPVKIDDEMVQIFGG